MAELIAKETRMPVLEATHRMLIQPNHAYVIPPNKYLTIKHRRLLLSSLGEAHTGAVIDLALRSLAEDQRENAIGIVLSGMGNYGSAGLKEIRLAGGAVLVQDPATAEHDEMPRAALASGITTDFVLAPEDMPEALIAYARHSSSERSEPLDPLTLEGLEAILALLQARSKSDFRYYRRNMILRRIKRRMALLQITDIRKYAERLRQDAAELGALRHDLLIGVTTFFREPEAFNVLARRALPGLVRRAGPDSPLRVWVPACSTGEEAYSVAILLIEQFRAAHKNVHLQIFATDVEDDSLKIARRGQYFDSIAATVSPERLQRFFSRSDPRHYQVGKQLRDVVVFAPQNLITDPPFSKLDLISCRNALIYLEPDIQAKVISLLHFALKDSGYLLLGPAETIGGAADLFEPISRKWRIYRKIGLARRTIASVPILAPGTSAGEPREPARRSAASSSELLQRLLLDELAPAAVLVNRAYQILSVQGPVVKYLNIPSGPLTQDLLAMSRESLRAAVRAAGERAIRRGTTVRHVHAKVRRNGRYLDCRISVRPVSRRGQEGLLLVLFEDAPAPPARKRTSGAREPTHNTRKLEAELRATRNDLQRTISELESSNEDLQASNQEVMSMNEELQSTNEELESSKEELQSLNEELTTVNNQLEDKVSDLDAANNDMTNLMVAADTAIVFLDRELRIRRFTAPAGKLLHLLPADLGRPFRHLAPKFSDGDLENQARLVMDTSTPSEKEVLSGDDRWYLRRVQPYRAPDGPLGVVLSFVDITQRIEAEAQSRLMAAVLRDSSDAIVVMDPEGRITAWNRGAELLYGYTEAEARKMTIADLTTEDSRRQAIELITRSARGEALPSFETKRRTRDGRDIDVSTTVTLLRNALGKPASLAMTERDVSARRRAEEEVRTLNAELERRVAERTHELQNSEEKMRAIVNASADAIITIDIMGRIVTFNRAATALFGYSAEEIVGQNVRMLMPPRERAEHDGYLRRYAETREPHIIGRPREFSACRKDGALFPISLSVTAIDESDLFVGCIHDLTAARALQQEVLNIAMLEQRRIGQELHDSTQQELSGLGLLAKNLGEMLGRQADQTSAELAARLTAGIAQANLHVRALARGLIPVPIDAASLTAALEELAASTQKTYGVNCRFESADPVRVSDTGTATHLYHIAQEAVANAVRHAKADTISIRLAHEEGDLLLEVADNGIGIDMRKLSNEGVGLRLMEHRCSIIGGRFNVTGHAAGGTVVTCVIPSISGGT